MRHLHVHGEIAITTCMLYANLILVIGEVTAMVPCVEGLRIGPDLGVTPQTGWGTGGLLAGREVELPPCACP